MRIIISLIATLLLFIINFYANSIYPDFTPMSMLFTLIISLVFFALAFIPDSFNKPKDTSFEQQKLKTYYKIAEITTSPMPLTSQLTKVCSVLEESLQIECAFICEYDQDKQNTIVRLNMNDTLNKFGIAPIYKPHKENLAKNSIEEKIALLYLEKRSELVDHVQTLQGDYTFYAQALKAKQYSKPLGVFIIITNQKYNYQEFLKSITELVAFSLYLNQKKIASQKFQEALNHHDNTLNIATSTALQTAIEKEYNRHLRYHTNLSLIVFEIDHLANLKNIFEEDIINTLLKDFTTLFQKNIRTNDFFGKWTDDKFAIVAPDIEFRAAKNFAKKLTTLLTEHRFSNVGKVTCSFGVTSLAQNDNMSAFRKRAEGALLEAQNKGGHSIEVKILV